MKIEILKCHGSGNDFILIDEYENKYPFSEINRPKISSSLCDRKGTLGADGILFFQKSDLGDAKMRMFNPDGSEAEMCGNGVRCIGRFANEKFEKPELFIETLKGIQKIKIEKEILKGVKTFSVNLKPISFKLSEIGINVEGQELNDSIIDGFSRLKFSAVSIGNPHIVSVVDDIIIAELDEIGKKANSDKKLFPNGINVSFCKIIETNKIVVVTYERGAGITYSCGSAMAASAITTVRQNLSKKGQWIEIYNKGGITKCMVEHGDKFEVHLLGNATFVFKSEIEIDDNNFKVSSVYKGQANIDEIMSYSKVVDFADKFLTENSIEIK